MKTIALSLCAAATLAACGSTAPAGAVTSPPDVRHVAFQCSDGETLSVRFYPSEERAVLIRHGQEIALRQQPSGSGFIYSNGPNTIRGKGRELTVEIGRRVPLQCQSQ